MKVACVKDFKSVDANFTKGKLYEYWTNFGGLNHFVEDPDGRVYPFDGELDDPNLDNYSSRDCWIWDYFMKIDDWRDDQIEKLELNIDEKPHCHICYTTNVEPDIMVCDTCDEIYCEGCSYTFSIHYQHQGARCYHCADQNRRIPITKDQIRDNKILLLI